MKKRKQAKSVNGNLFKTVVRGIVKDEVGKVETRLGKVETRLGNLEDKLDSSVEQLEEKIENTYRKYRDDVLTKMDEVIGELKTTREEQAAGLMLHEELEERVESLESIHPQGKHAK